MSYLFVMRDKTTDYGSKIMEFEGRELAVTVVRQQLRDAYIKGEITDDYIGNNELVCIGEYDPAIMTVFDYGEQEIHYGLRLFVEDLKDDVRRGANADYDESRTSNSGVPGDSVLRV